MATALEHRQQGEQFRVMDAANLPDEPASPTVWSSPAAGLQPACFWDCSSRRCSSIAILPCAMRGTSGPSPSCRLWPSCPTSTAFPSPQRIAAAGTRFHERPSPLKARAANHVQILLRPSRPPFRSQSRSAVSLHDAADSGDACLPAIRHCGTQGLCRHDGRSGHGKNDSAQDCSQYILQRSRFVGLRLQSASRCARLS
jgi:hypothetical protein